MYRNGKTGNITYYIEKPIECKHCKKEIGYNQEMPVIAVHVLDWTKKGLVESVYHELCFRNFKPSINSVVPERKSVYVINNRPQGSVLVTPRPPSVRASNRSELSLDFLSMASKPSDRTTDNTVHSGYESFEGMSIGCDESLLLCESKDKQLGVVEGVELLDKLLLDSQKAIAEIKKNQLEE